METQSVRKQRSKVKLGEDLPGKSTFVVLNRQVGKILLAHLFTSCVNRCSNKAGSFCNAFIHVQNVIGTFPGEIMPTKYRKLSKPTAAMPQ